MNSTTKKPIGHPYYACSACRGAWPSEAPAHECPDRVHEQSPPEQRTATKPVTDTYARITIGGRDWPPTTKDVHAYLDGKEKRTTLTPMRAGTSHVIRLGGMSGQFTASGAGIPTRPGLSRVAVCSHVDCAGRSWPSRDALVDDHGYPGPPHAWGWWHGGKLYAPAEVTPPAAPTFRIDVGEGAPTRTLAEAAALKEVVQRHIESIFPGVTAVGEGGSHADLLRRAALARCRADHVGEAFVKGLAEGIASVERKPCDAPTAADTIAADIIRKLPEVTPEAVERVQQEARRRAREAPLVALVAAVPEGLDPAGWRAAVLAVSEMCIRRKGQEPLDRIGDVWKTEDTIALVMLVACVGTEESPRPDRTPLDVAHRAYARAVAPQGPRTKVERKIGGRAVRLVVDHGE